MAQNPITVQLPADLPTNWTTGQTVAPAGQSVGLAQQYGYNYLMAAVNAAQTAAAQLGAAFANLASLTNGKIPSSQLPIGVANGIAGLDGNAKVPSANLPAMNYLPTAGGTMTGQINMGGQPIVNLPAPTANTNPVRLQDTYLSDDQLSAATRTLYGVASNATPDDVLQAVYNMSQNKSNIAIKEYIGTGTFGEGNPSSITFDEFDPAFVIVSGYPPYAQNGLASLAIFLPGTLSSEFNARAYAVSNGSGYWGGLNYVPYSSTSFANAVYAKYENQTLYWYSTTVIPQMNYTNMKYLCVAFGENGR